MKSNKKTATDENWISISFHVFNKLSPLGVRGFYEKTTMHPNEIFVSRGPIDHEASESVNQLKIINILLKVRETHALKSSTYSLKGRPMP